MVLPQHFEKNEQNSLIKNEEHGWIEIQVLRKWKKFEEKKFPATNNEGIITFEKNNQNLVINVLEIIYDSNGEYEYLRLTP